MLPTHITRNCRLSRLGSDSLRVLSRLASSSTQSQEQSTESADQPEQPAVNRDVSGLRPWHHRRYHGQAPVIDQDTSHLASLRWQRRIWAQYGAKSGVNPAVAWPVKVEWEDKMEYEALAYPDTLQEMVRKSREEQADREKVVRQRMETIEKNMANLEKWKKEITDRKQRKQRELQAQKDKHDQLIEEVREYLGYRVDMKDDRFKEILEKKQLEEKKSAKEAKKKERAAKAIAKYQKMSEEIMEKEKNEQAGTVEVEAKGQTDSVRSEKAKDES